MADKQYDVFLSYHPEDRPAIERLAVYLHDTAKLRPWFDEWELIPGEPWVRNLERGLAASETCAVFVGKSGEGPWQQREVETVLRHQVNHRDFRVIPVLLPDAPKQPELPMFLSGNRWVDFREKRLDDDDALWRLECGIVGKAPGRGRPTQSQTPPNMQREIHAEPEQRIQQEPPKKKPPAKPQQTKVTPDTSVIRLRSEPATVSTKNALQVFALTERKFDWGTGWVPRTYITNQYEDMGDMVFDHATGLMWQKSGSPNYMPYENAQAYIKQQLNDQKFGGYNDWRLPTIPELMSLLEPEKQSNDLYINPIFDATQQWCWSADRLPEGEQRSAGPAWVVGFYSGSVRWYFLTGEDYVRGVRS
jgi:hypothetical protein